MERRRLICSVMFHLLAIICVIWSVYVMVDRIIDEVANRQMSWQFWTKLVVVTIGLVGGLVFSYVQCRLYYELIYRWHDYNRVFLVQVPSEESLKKVRNQRAAAAKVNAPDSPQRQPRVSATASIAPDAATTVTVVPEEPSLTIETTLP